MIEVKDIGQLSQRIDVYAQTITADTTTGERKQSFTLTGTYWANVEFSSGSETIGGDIAYGLSKILVTIRYNSSVNDNSIVTWDSKNYNVRAIEFDSKKMFMVLTCESAK